MPLQRLDYSIFYEFLLFLAIILISTKVLGLFSRKVHMPAVVGALAAGIVLGPSVLKLITLDGTNGVYLEITAEIGVIFLMFSAGLETDLKEIKANALASFIVALIGVIVPLIGGFLGYALYFHTDFTDYQEVLKSVFIGVVLTATSVSITVETLRELGRLKGRVGTTILGAAVIDDILGIIVLTIVTSLKDTSVNPVTVMVKIVLYFIVIGILFFLVSKCKPLIESEGQKRRVTVFALAFCFLLSYISEKFFGIADITGAYIAGLIISNVQRSTYLESKFDTLSYLLLSPVFFASIGLKVNLPQMSVSIIMFAVALTVVAVLTKIVGCGLGAKICGYKNYQAKRIGVGMISRGEVALIVASKGSALGLMSSSILGPVIVVVVITTVITPILLKVVFAPGTGPSTQVEDAKKVTSYYENREDNR